MGLSKSQEQEINDLWLRYPEALKRINPQHIASMTLNDDAPRIKEILLSTATADDISGEYAQKIQDLKEFYNML